MNKEEDVMVVDSAFGDNFDAFYTKPKSTPPASEAKSDSKEVVGSNAKVDGAEDSLLKPYFDGSASWFTFVSLLLSQIPG